MRYDRYLKGELNRCLKGNSTYYPTWKVKNP